MQDDEERQLCLDITHCDHSHFKHTQALERKRKQLEATERNEQQENRKKQAGNDPHYRKAFKSLRSSALPPLTYIKRVVKGPQGQAPGTYAQNPLEIDDILTDQFQNIYRGSSDDHLVTIIPTSFPNTSSISSCVPPFPHSGLMPKGSENTL